MKNIKELRLSVGTDLGVAPYLKKGHARAAMNTSADNAFGGVMGIGRTLKGYKPEDFKREDEDEDDKEDILDVLLREFSVEDGKKYLTKNISKALNVGKSALFSIPVFGDLFAAFNFLFKYFGPFGLQAAVENFTEQLSDYSGIYLGKDFLEPEGFDKENNIELSDMSDNEYTEYLENALKVFNSVDSNTELSNKLNLSNVQALLDGYDAILDDLRQCFIAFFGAVDFAIGQQAFYANIMISIIEPEDLVDWLVLKYARVILPEIKEEVPDANSLIEKLKNIPELVSLPLDRLGNLDLLFNVEKLKRFVIVNNALKKIKERKNMLSGDSDENRIVSIVLDKILEKKNYSIASLMESYLEEDQEETFEKIDLEKLNDKDEIEEFSGSAAAGGSFSLPLGKSTKNKPDDKHIRMYEKKLEEQRDYIKRLQLYHLKTTNNIK